MVNAMIALAMLILRNALLALTLPSIQPIQPCLFVGAALRGPYTAACSVLSLVPTRTFIRFA